jgi:hypothetical protein
MRLHAFAMLALLTGACVHGDRHVFTPMGQVQLTMAPVAAAATSSEPMPAEIKPYAVSLPTPAASEYTSYEASIQLYGPPGQPYAYALVCDGGSLTGSIMVPERHQPAAPLPPPPPAEPITGAAVVQVPGGEVGVGVQVRPTPPPPGFTEPVAVTPFVEQSIGAVQPRTANSCSIAMWSEAGTPTQLPVTVVWNQRFDQGEASADARAEHARVQLTAALALRARLRGHLVKLGADPDLRARIALQRQQDEAKARAARAYRLEAERAERARIEQHRYTDGIELRARYKARWVAMGADPGKWQRERTARETARAADLAEARERQAEVEARDSAARERARLAQQARLRVEAEARAQAEAEIRAHYAAALRVRGQVRLRLEAQGAVPRPPMPAAQVETPPAAPYASAAWVTGHWMWNGGAWVWVGGRWEVPPVPGQVWVGPLRVVIDGGTVVRPGAWVKVRVR